ncbi:MAG TPA: alkaline phosphatase family protein [Gemmatimonadaceae bacterium]|nr:alkaline phosphatase family protein [Gemmatimonadaceae bacterium]
MAAARAPRIVVIGLDLGDGALIREWAAEGALPHLHALMAAGAVAELDTTARWLHVSAWPTLYTGASPGQHGVYYTFQPAPGLQGYARFGAGQYGTPTFWRLLADAGVQSTVFDAPYTHPEPGSSAAQLFDWGTWAHYWKTASTPPALLSALNRTVGRYPLGLEAHDLGLVALDATALQPRLIASARTKTSAILWLMQQRPWDCFVTVYGETHLGGHYCWRPSAGLSDGRPDLEGLKALYQEIDRGIGRIIESLPKDTTVFVVSGDSIGPNHSGWHLLPDVLRRLGLLAEPAVNTTADDQGVDGEPAPRARPGWDPVRALRDALPKDFRKGLARRLPTALRDRLARRVDTAGIDWSRTRAFALPTDLEGCIRINLAGREPLGIVQPGAEYDRLCDEMTMALRELVNPDTGERAVRDVIRTDRQLSGPRSAFLPDLVVLWSAAAPITALQSERIGTVSAPSPDGRTGTHTAPGLLIGSGPGMTSGSFPRGAHVRDLAPTILSLYGIERPAYMDGAMLVSSSFANQTGDLA